MSINKSSTTSTPSTVPFKRSRDIVYVLVWNSPDGKVYTRWYANEDIAKHQLEKKKLFSYTNFSVERMTKRRLHKLKLAAEIEMLKQRYDEEDLAYIAESISS